MFYSDKKLKVVVGYSRVWIISLDSDNTTELETVADVPLQSTTTLTGYAALEEIQLETPEGINFTLQYKAIHTVVNPAGSVISSVVSYATMLSLLQDHRSAALYPSTAVNIANADPAVVAMAAQIDDQDLPESGYTGLHINCTVAADLTGLVAPTEEAQNTVFLHNSGTADISILHEDANSVAANRFDLPGDVDATLGANGYAILWYNSTTSRWNLINNL